MDRYDRVLQLLTGISLGVGLLVVLRTLELYYFLYYPRTTDTVLISSSLDLYLFLVTSLCVPGWFIGLLRERRKGRRWIPAAGVSAVWIVALASVAYSKYVVALLYLCVVAVLVEISLSRISERRAAMAHIMVGFLMIIALVESAPIYYWAFASVNPFARFGAGSEMLEANLTFAPFMLGPGILVALLLSWLWVPLLSRVLPARRKMETAKIEPTRGVEGRLVLASLDLLAIVAILVFFFLYLAGQRWIVGVDSYINYLNPLNSVRALSPLQALMTLIGTFHGVYVSILYLLTLGTGIGSFSIVKFAPLVLAFSTAGFVFLTFLKAGWAYRPALFSSLCTLLWLPTTLGVYAGIQANWAALALWMLFLAVFFMNWEMSALKFLVQSLLSAAILLIHPWTWGVFLATFAVTGLFSVRTNRIRHVIASICSVLAAAIPIAAVAYFYFGTFRTDMDRTISTYLYPFLQPASLLRFWGAVPETLSSWSSFLSPTVMIIALLGAYRLISGEESVSKTYLAAWIVTWCVGSFVAAPLGYNPTNPSLSETQLWRMLYVSPLPIFLAMGLESCFAFVSGGRRLVGGISRVEWILMAGSAMLAGLILFASEMPALRIFIVVLMAGWLVFIMTRYPIGNVARVLTILVLVLLVVNAAFRSIYPLLLDPRSLQGTWGFQSNIGVESSRNPVVNP